MDKHARWNQTQEKPGPRMIILQSPSAMFSLSDIFPTLVSRIALQNHCLYSTGPWLVGISYLTTSKDWRQELYC